MDRRIHAVGRLRKRTERRPYCICSWSASALVSGVERSVEFGSPRQSSPQPPRMVGSHGAHNGSARVQLSSTIGGSDLDNRYFIYPFRLKFLMLWPRA